MAFEDSDRQFPLCLPPRLDNETQRSLRQIPFAAERTTGFTGAVLLQN
ncbi:hypothetical protein [Marivita geojedonensis]|nr:hypothetical protein [Marivita geojedonensis]